MKFDDHFLSWILIYAVLVYISESLVGFFNIESYLLILIVVGFVISLGSWILYSILYKNRFVLNGWFIIWIFTHAISYWLIGLILGLLTINIQFLYYLSFGLIFHLWTYFIKNKIYKKFEIKKRGYKLIITFLALILILFFVSSSTISDNQISENVSFIDKLKSLFDSVSINSNSCPEMKVPLSYNNELGYYITNIDPNNYYIHIVNGTPDLFPTADSDAIQKGWKISVYNTAELFGIKTDYVFCHKGNSEGENPNYFYCDSGGLAGGIPYLRKTQMNSDGTIGKTIEKSFFNVYDENKNFLKTICGKPPEDIAEEEFRKWMNSYNFD